MLNFNDIDINLNKGEDKTNEKSYRKKDIAVIGISVKLPMADSIEEFWFNLDNSVDCIRDIPKCRKEDADKYLNYIGRREYDMTYCESAYLEEIDKFDYKYFKLSPKEACLMDPNQRLFLETAWEAIEDSGYGGKKLVGSRTGVYLGYSKITSNTYFDMISKVDPSYLVLGLAGNIVPIIASRISYLMDFRGPSMVVDTTCSSSLVALHLACQAIRNGECDLAIAGCSKVDYLPLDNGQRVGTESSTNRTKAFDDASDGTGTGEGVIALLLKPMRDAIKDKDNIYAVIKGSAVNQDGSSIGITAPNSLAQEDVIIRAWKDAGINPETITYIEAHGTGTKLGDPIEIDGLTRAFRKFTNKKQFCAISALKTNIGHLDNGAGLAGIVKAILALKNSTIPPMLHFKMPNRKIDFGLSPVYINDLPTKWETDENIKRCGVSSFGISGTNCHVVLEEAPYKNLCKDIEKMSGYEVLTLSARTENSLKRLVKKYIDVLEGDNCPDLRDICYTANTGREHCEFRLAVMVKEKKTVIEILKRVSRSLDISENISNVFWGKNDSTSINNTEKIRDITREKILRFVESNKKDIDLLGEICEIYVKGAQVEWELLYAKEERSRVRLPVYPFERIRCWIEIPDKKHLRLDSLYLKELSCGLEGVSDELSREIELTVNKWMQEINSDETYQENKNVHSVKLKGRENHNYSSAEKIVGEAWSRVLGFKELDIYDNFYELGGDSIIAMKIVNHLSSELNSKIEIIDLLNTMTIEKMSIKISSKLQDPQTTNKNYVPITKVDEREYYPLSSAQKRMFISDSIQEEGTNYNIFGAFDIKGTLDIKRLEDSINEIVKRHESLRTSFEWKDGVPVQIVHKDVKIKIKIKDICEESITCEISELIQPFNLKTAPLFRVDLLKYGDNKYIFVYNMHHIISDGFSMSIFVDEIMRLYNGEKLLEPKIQYRDFAVWQNDFLESEDIRKQEEYWLNLFDGEIPILNLPKDLRRPEVVCYDGDRIDDRVEKDLAKKLKKIALESKTTLYNVLLSAYYILLLKNTGQEDIIVGSPVAGRQNFESESIIGMFVNMIALRNYPSESKSFNELLNEVKENCLRAFENQDYQFEKLCEKLCLVRDTSRSLIFDTVFILQNIDIKALEIDNLEVTPIKYKADNVPYSILLVAMEEDRGINFTFEYQKSIFKRSMVENLVKNYLEILNQVAENKDLKIEDISITNNSIKAVSVIDDKDSLEFDF